MWRVVSGAAVVAVAVAWPHAQKFATSVPGVRLVVGVVRGNQPVRGLTERDFEVFDNGTRQEITVSASSDSAIDIAVVVPPPREIAANDDLVEAALGQIHRLLRSTDRLALVSAAAPPFVTRPLGPAVTNESLSAPRKSGPTAVLDAMLHAMTLLRSPDRRRVAVMFTDGAEDNSWTLSRTLREVVPRTAVSVVVCGLRTSTPAQALVIENDRGTVRESVHGLPRRRSAIPRYLLEIAAASGGRVMDLNDRLPEHLARLFDALRAEYVLTYTPKLAAEGWHEIKVRLTNKKGVVITRPGYWLR
jgi:VWFA-related protein